MHRFSNDGKLQPRKCIGVFAESMLYAGWTVYIKDKVGDPPLNYIQVSYNAVGGVRKKAIKYARQIALSIGYDLVQVI